MNKHTRKAVANSALDILKEEVRLVLYEQYKEGKQYATLILIRERLELPRGRSGQNHLVRGILEILEIPKYVAPYYQFPAAWHITEKGISLIESK